MSDKSCKDGKGRFTVLNSDARLIKQENGERRSVPIRRTAPRRGPKVLRRSSENNNGDVLQEPARDKKRLAQARLPGFKEGIPVEYRKGKGVEEVRKNDARRLENQELKTAIRSRKEVPARGRNDGAKGSWDSSDGFTNTQTGQVRPADTQREGKGVDA